MRFNVAFGKTNTFSLDLVPVTNQQYVNDLASRNQPVSEIDLTNSFDHPDNAHPYATLLWAREMCKGGTVVYA